MLSRRVLQRVLSVQTESFQPYSSIKYASAAVALNIKLARARSFEEVLSVLDSETAIDNNQYAFALRVIARSMKVPDNKRNAELMDDERFKIVKENVLNDIGSL